MNKTKKVLILFLLGAFEPSLRSGFQPFGFFGKKKSTTPEKSLKNTQNQQDSYEIEKSTTGCNEKTQALKPQQKEKKTKAQPLSFYNLLTSWKNPPIQKIAANLQKIFQKNSQNSSCLEVKRTPKVSEKKNTPWIFQKLSQFYFGKKIYGPKDKKNTEVLKTKQTQGVFRKTFKSTVIPTTISPGDLSPPETNILAYQKKVPCFKELIAYALETDLNIQKASLEVKKASENLSKAMVGWRPNANVSANGQYQQTNEMDVLNDQDNRRNIWTHNAGANVDYNLFEGGRVVYDVKAARLQLASAIADYFSAIQDVMANLAKMYIKVISHSREVKIYENFLPYAQKAYTHAEAQYTHGLAKYTDLSQAALSLATYVNAYNEKRAQLVQARADLEQQAGCLLCDELEEAPSLKNPDTLEKALEMAKKNNPKFQALMKAEEASTFDLKKATAMFSPVLSVNGGVNFDNNNTISVDEAQNRVAYDSGLQGGLTLKMPIPINGEIQNNVRQARLGINAARIELEKVRREVWAALRQLYAQFIRNVDSLKYLEKSNVLAKKSLEASQAEFFAGLMDMTTLVEIQNRALQNELNYNGVRYGLQEISFEIAKNIGILTPESLDIVHTPLYEPYLKRYQNSLLNIRVKDTKDERKAFKVSKDLYNLSSFGDM